MIWDINLIILFFAVGDVLLISTEQLHTAILQITKPSVVEGETVEFRCVITAAHGEQPNKERNWFHLYKNREKVSSLPDRGIAAVTFVKEDIRKNGTGNYTCMYGNQNPGDVKNISHGPPIYLNVQESQHSLMLQLDKECAMEGMDISFKCMIPVELKDAIQKDGFFHLYKNGSIVDSQPVPKGLPAVTFSIKKVNRSDTGNYTCVYGKETIVNSANNKRSRPVYLDVTECLSPTTTCKTQQNNSTGSVLSLYLGAGVGSGILVLLLLLIGGLLKCQQSKRDPAVQIVPVYSRVVRPCDRPRGKMKSNQPLNPEDDTLTYSEINTARVTKKKPRSAPDEANVTYSTIKTSTH
ncbi:uncharacterized protein LOC117405516 isoform X1 [Acipenser ruthenus]|uniref:uncharacterized protein LOC117405516 isoform X1 n=1 Tax=Acipenser ruthenus TaxID=7906 RepID=UPI00145B145D|nr:uncharacterized protein LOC117405516 isoform X1 [Acipenser ruthenus]